MPWSVVARLALMFVVVVMAYAWIGTGSAFDVAKFLRGSFKDLTEPATRRAPRILELGPRDRQLLEAQRRRASEIAREVTYLNLRGRIHELESLQEIVDRGVIPDDDRYSLQCLGVALGDIMVTELGLEWVVYEDEVQPSRALRIPGTDQVIFPVTMISKRVERGVPVDVRELFESARQILRENRAPQLGDVARAQVEGIRPARLACTTMSRSTSVAAT